MIYFFRTSVYKNSLDLGYGHIFVLWIWTGPIISVFSSCEATNSPGVRRWRGGRAIASWVINDVFAVTSFVSMKNTVAARQFHDPQHCLVTQNEPLISKQVPAPFSFFQPQPTLSYQLKGSLNNILIKWSRQFW